ncbi:MAG: PLP-dependent transferase [Acidaminococcaceae bacterium]|nr:PLP-dependent transferase [Acidaminococcaceae bacterium]MBQ9320362.1 PLP-dependent transferase [Acidaminococcaceae bacterium]
MDFSTLCIHGGYQPDCTGSVTAPIYTSTAYAHPGVQQSTGYDYIRTQNPTRESVERCLAALEGGTDGFAFSSGMAALGCLLELFQPGDHFIVTADLYGGSIRYLNAVSCKNGLAYTEVDTGNLETVEKAYRPDTKAVYIETPSNPTMQITDIRAISAWAHARNLKVIVDNTFLTPYFQKPLLLGADIVLHSGTKYLGGHNDLLAGILVTKNEEDAERIKFLQNTIGAVLSPFDSWLLLRGLKTLPLRMERHAASALQIAKWLQRQLQVRKVFYPGLEDSLRYAANAKQVSGFGGMISFEVESEAFARSVLSKLKLVLFAESLGGTETLLTYPLLQTHSDVPREEALAKGINERLLRLSVGLEAPEDIIADLEQAFAAAVQEA